MNPVTPLYVSIAATVASILLILIVLELIRSRRLRERYALLWLATGVVLLVLSAWRGGLNTIAGWVGVTGYPPAVLFAVATLFILAVLLHYSTVISKLADQNVILAQRLALLEQRLRSGREALVLGRLDGARQRAEPAREGRHEQRQRGDEQDVGGKRGQESRNSSPLSGEASCPHPEGDLAGEPAAELDRERPGAPRDGDDPASGSHCSSRWLQKYSRTEPCSAAARRARASGSAPEQRLRRRRQRGAGSSSGAGRAPLLEQRDRDQEGHALGIAGVAGQPEHERQHLVAQRARRSSRA